MASSRAPICPVLAGPTAAGKTSLILDAAARHPIEVISLDSRQIYRGLRIGTAQPTAAEQAACPHHLIDFVPPEERYSAQRFRVDFQRVYMDIRSRGAFPLLVGGAGMYLTAVREGFFELPEDPRRLAAIRAELDGLDDDAVDRLLRVEDPESRRRIPVGDRYRSRRALEIGRLAGRPMSALIAEHRPQPVLGLSFPLILLDLPVEALARRIEKRLGAMLAGGWIEETRELLRRHAADCPGLRTLGYSQVAAHLRGELDIRSMTAEIALRTRQYAKRQRTWFRRLDTAACGTPDDAAVRSALDECIAAARTAPDRS